MPFGNDTIDVRDGEADNVDCGVGADKVVADALDTVAPNCEQIDRSPARSRPRPGPGARPRSGWQRGDARGRRDGEARIGR